MKRIKIFIVILIWLLVIPMFINAYIILSTKNKIYDSVDAVYDIGIILGCSVLSNKKPSLMLKDRLEKGIELYNNGSIKKILITGDHNSDYSEVEVMYNYLIDKGIKNDDILIDNKGYSTSESLLNYKNNHYREKGIIITQKYHLFRSIYIANKLNLNVIGIAAKKVRYNGQFLREIREILARNKDFIKMNFL